MNPESGNEPEAAGRKHGLNKGLVFWGAILTLFTGWLGIAIAVFGDKRKRGDRLIGSGIVIVAATTIAIVAVAAAGSGGGGRETVTSSAGARTPVSKSVGAPKYKLRAGDVSCEADALGSRVCRGSVTNISDKPITDLQPGIHWVGGTDSDFGSIDINPILPGQTANFTIYTLHPNPALTKYRLFFKKLFGSEDDFPLEP